VLSNSETKQVNNRSTTFRKRARTPQTRIRSVMLPCEFTREHANPAGSTLNPKVEGSNPSRPIPTKPFLRPQRNLGGRCAYEARTEHGMPNQSRSGLGITPRRLRLRRTFTYSKTIYRIRPSWTRSRRRSSRPLTER
jgi:hypothetical protein